MDECSRRWLYQPSIQRIRFAAGVGTRGPAAPVGVLTLQRSEERLRCGVVPAHPGRTHRLHDTVTVAEFAELGRGVLRSAVGVEHDTGVDSATPCCDRGIECVGDEFGAHVISNGPADHSPKQYRSMTVAK